MGLYKSPLINNIVTMIFRTSPNKLTYKHCKQVKKNSFLFRLTLMTDVFRKTRCQDGQWASLLYRMKTPSRTDLLFPSVFFQEIQTSPFEWCLMARSTQQQDSARMFVLCTTFKSGWPTVGFPLSTQTLGSQSRYSRNTFWFFIFFIFCSWTYFM